MASFTTVAVLFFYFGTGVAVMPSTACPCSHVSSEASNGEACPQGSVAVCPHIRSLTSCGLHDESRDRLPSILRGVSGTRFASLQHMSLPHPRKVRGQLCLLSHM